MISNHIILKDKYDLSNIFDKYRNY